MSIWPINCFKDRHVIVSGGTSGIGAAIAASFASEGAHVTVTGATEAEARAARAAMPQVTAAALDVRDGAAVVDFLQNLDRVDHLVNCAGVIRRTEELQPDTFAEVIDINLNGTMRMCAASRPFLARTGGTIVNTASMLSFFGGGLVPGYAASKGGVAQLTKSLAIAYAADGIRVNAIAPGWIATPLTQALQADPARSGPILARTPMARWGQPQDLVGGVAFLSSPMASFVTGTLLVIDGGYMIT